MVLGYRSISVDNGDISSTTVAINVTVVVVLVIVVQCVRCRRKKVYVRCLIS